MTATRFLAVAALCVLALTLASACGSEGVPVSAESTPSNSTSAMPPSSVPGTSAAWEAFGSAAMHLIRTDFSDDAAWRKIVAITTGPDATDDGTSEYGPYEPQIGTVEDRRLDGWSTADLTAAWDPARRSEYILVADAQSMREANGTGIVTVDLVDLNQTDLKPGEKDEYGFTTEDYGFEYGRSFRCQLEQVASIEANLSLSNMDFFEFADAADDNGGVFTGFEE